MRPVGVRVVEAMTTLVAGSSPARLAGVTEVSRSKPSSTSIVPGRVSPSEMVDTTGPAFWLRPVWSTACALMPSILAAAPRSWLTVTTPVPPMPGMRMVTPEPGTMSAGAGRGAPPPATAGPPRDAPRPLFAGLTVTNAGQSPFTQLRSRLQLA